MKFISIARISKEKGTLYAIKSLSLLNLSSKSKVEFDLYGAIYDDDYWIECKKEMNKLPANIIVTYKGIVESKLIPNMLEHYHFLLLPS